MGHYQDSYDYDREQQEKAYDNTKAKMSVDDLKHEALNLIERILNRKAIGNREKIAAEWLVDELRKAL